MPDADREGAHPPSCPTRALPHCCTAVVRALPVDARAIGERCGATHTQLLPRPMWLVPVLSSGVCPMVRPRTSSQPRAAVVVDVGGGGGVATPTSQVVHAWRDADCSAMHVTSVVLVTASVWPALTGAMVCARVDTSGVPPRYARQPTMQFTDQPARRAPCSVRQASRHCDTRPAKLVVMTRCGMATPDRGVCLIVCGRAAQFRHRR